MEFHGETPTSAELLAALHRLTPETQPGWGKLNAAGMVQHVNRFVELYLGERKMGGVAGWLARHLGKAFLRRVAQKSPFDTPRNMATAPVLAVASGVDFEAEVARFEPLFGQIDALSGTYAHPVYGPMDAEDVKGLVRHHTAHHFHQFGLLAREGLPAGR